MEFFLLLLLWVAPRWKQGEVVNLGVTNVTLACFLSRQNEITSDFPGAGVECRYFFSLKFIQVLMRLVAVFNSGNLAACTAYLCYFVNMVIMARVQWWLLLWRTDHWYWLLHTFNLSHPFLWSNRSCRFCHRMKTSMTCLPKARVG